MPTPIPEPVLHRVVLAKGSVQTLTRTSRTSCTRSCFQCPICIGPLVVTSLETPPDSTLLAVENATQSTGPYVLTCSYCQWSSSEIGIQFDKPNGIYQQLAKMSNGGKPRLTAKEFKERSRREKDAEPESHSSPVKNTDVDSELQFSQLKAFYQSQLNETNPQAAAGLGSLADLGISSPGSLSRIMSIYTGAGHGASHKQARGRVPVMREARTLDEGFKEADLDDSAIIDKLRASTLEDCASPEQRLAQLTLPYHHNHHHPPRFVDDLRPIPCLLRTKRSKRCPACRHIISKPESKISNPRFRIRLIAGSYIPTITVRPFHTPESLNVPSGLRPPLPAELWLSPHRPAQYILTFQNPVFEPVKVTLATPATTPGRFASTVTLLCPQFDISANTDMWDDALKDDADLQQRRAGEDGGVPAQPEPGKIWERGRNWVSVVVEVVPASLRLDALPPGPDGEEPDRSPLKEDEDVLEIPMFVRVEWETDTRDDMGSSTASRDVKESREKRELAYWCVLGLGRIARE